MGIFDKLKQKVTGRQIQPEFESQDYITDEQVPVEEPISEVPDSDKEFSIVESQQQKLKSGLSKTRNSFIGRIKSVLGIGRKIDTVLINDIEDILLTADIGFETTMKIIDSLKERVKQEGQESSEDVYKQLKEEILKVLSSKFLVLSEEEKTQNSKLKTQNSNPQSLIPNTQSLIPNTQSLTPYYVDESKKPHTILVIGVNGVGKTTTIGKLAYNYRNAGKQVIIGAADTFRAAANEQLEIWAERAGVPVVQQKQGADPAAVAYDTLNSAISKKADVVIIDTAGRLHNKGNLMAELEKISRVMKKLKPDAPDEVFLVLDATTGQNAIQQAKEFQKIASITGIILTKLDGTAKGGVVIPIANELKIPVKYIGVGEKIDDLQVFDPVFFVEALFEVMS